MKLMVILLMVCAVLPTHAQEKTTKPTEKQQASQTVPLQYPPSSNIVVIDTQAAKPDKDGRQYDAKNYLLRLLGPENLPNLGLLLAGIVGICVTVKTLRAIQRQGLIMIRQARIMQQQRGVMDGQLAQMTAQVTEMSRQTAAANASARALISSERAWIMVDLEFAPRNYAVSESGGKTRVNVNCICTNLGKTAAKITKISAAGIILQEVATTYSLPDAPDRTKLIEEMSGLETVTAAAPFQKSFCVVCDGSRQVGLSLVVYGVVSYRHLFSKDEVETTFGYRVTAAATSILRLEDHPQYNENT